MSVSPPVLAPPILLCRCAFCCFGTTSFVSELLRSPFFPRQNFEREHFTFWVREVEDGLYKLKSRDHWIFDCQRRDHGLAFTVLCSLRLFAWCWCASLFLLVLVFQAFGEATTPSFWMSREICWRLMRVIKK